MRASCLLVFAATSCVAPPLGLGTGAHRDVARGGIDASAGIGVTAAREVVQLEGSSSRRFGDRFTLEYGGVVTQLAARRDDGILVGIGALPYVRPRWTLGPWSIALAGWVAAASGGEGGAIGGFGDVQVGYGGAGWSIYGGGYGLGYVDAFGPSTAAAQARLGGECLVPARDGGRVGVALELFTGVDALQAIDDDRARTSRPTGVAVKLRVEGAGPRRREAPRARPTGAR